MSSASPRKIAFFSWSPRARLYGLAIIVCLVYLLVGRLSSSELQWVQVYLPLSTASVLLVTAAGIESYFLLRQWQKRHAELVELREREQELSQRLAAQRQSILNQVSRALIDKLDSRHIPQEVFERTAALFEGDIVAVWFGNYSPGVAFELQGCSGLDEATTRSLAAITHATPCFETVLTRGKAAVVQEFARDTTTRFAEFCQTTGLGTALLSPIITRGNTAGLIAVFYRQARPLPNAFPAELQTIANLIAGSLQAEELYRDLVQIQKIDSLGTLASGIAHDFNNVLAAILGCASYVKQQTDPASPAYRYLDATEKSAHRGAALTKQLLSFVRRESPRVTVLDPNDVLESTLEMIEHSFDKNIVIHRRLAPELGRVEMDPSQLEQIILNVAVNARDAMPQGGTFTIASRNARLDAADPSRPMMTLPDGHYVVLSFRDTGHGMDELTLKRVFEPFFTTKSRGNGTGLGLSVVQSIVRSFGGEIRAASALGKGALFEVYLPITTKPLPVKPKVSGSKARGGAECILIVEDEEVIREMAKLELEARGYHVAEAVDGLAALELYRRDWRKIDLVLADMVMPRMSGPELFEQMKQINGNVRLVVSSGYSHDLEGRRMLEHGCLGFLQKPYSPEALCHTIRSVLDSGL